MIQFFKVGDFRCRVDMLKSYEVEGEEVIITLLDPEETQVSIPYDSENEAQLVAAELDKLFFKTA